MKPSAFLRRFLAIAGSAALATPLTQAATLYWDNTAGGAINDGTGAWLGAGLWNNGAPSASWASGDNAIFGNFGAGAAVTLASPTTAGSLTFNYFTGTYTLGTASQTITINSGITKNAGSGVVTFVSPITLGGAQTWTNNSATNLSLTATNLNGNALTVSGAGVTTFDGNVANVLSGAGGILKSGSGSLILDGGTSITHTFSGGITITGGSVRFQNATNVSGRGNVSINGGYLGGRFGSSPTFAGGLGTGATAIQILGGTSGFSGEGGTGSTFTIGAATDVLKWGATGVNGATGFFNPTVLILGGDQGMNTTGKGTLANSIDLNGANRSFTSLHSNWDGGAGNGFTLTRAIINTAGTAAGIIRTGVGNIILTAANTYDGTTTLNGGTVTLSGSGTIASTTALNLGGGILRLVNTANTQRFADVAISATAGGGITYENTAGAVNYTESLGALTLTKGLVNVLLSNDHNAAAGSQKLTFGTAGTGNLTQGGGRGTITFSAPTTGLNATKNIVAVFGATDSGAGGIIGPWATVGTSANVQTAYAAYDASGFVIAATPTAATVDTDLSSSTGNYNINTGSLFTLAATRSVNAVQFQGAASTLDLATFKLETNGLFFSGGTTNTKTITGTGTGALTTASGGGNLYITTGQVMTAGSEARINAPITDNSGTVHLVKSGAGILRLNGVNTFTGNIDINAGTLQIGTNATANGAKLGSTGTYAGNIFIAAGANLDFQTDADQTLSGVISGDGNLLKRYIGTLTLGDDNTYTGKTTIGAITNTPSPTLVVSSFNSLNGGTPLLANSSLGAPTTLANATIEMGSSNSSPNPTLRYAGVAATGETTDRVINFIFNASATRTLDASGSGLLKFTSPFTSSGLATGQLALTGTGAGEIAGLPFLFGTLTKNGGGTWTLAGPVGAATSVTLSGATAGSRLNINHSQALGTGTFTVSGGNNATIGNTSGADITLTANNAQTWSNDFAVVATNSLNMGTGAVSMGGTRAIAVSGAGAYTVGGVVSGATFGITLGGSGTMALTNQASTYTGQTIIGNNVANTLKLQVTKLADLSATSSLGAPTTAGNGLIQIGATSNTSTLELIGGTAASSTNRQIQIGSSSNGSGGATILNNNTNSAHTLTFSNAAFNVAATGVTSSSRNLTLGGTNTGDNTISGAIIPNTGGAGVTGLIKTGTGTWILSGTNTYTGATNINQGTLNIASSGSTHASSAVTVSNSGSALVVNGTVNGTLVMNASTTLSGDGTINGAATISGIHTPGNSPGIQTFSNGLAYDSTATLNAEFVGDALGLRGTDYDGVNLAGGNLSIDPLASLSLYASGIDYSAVVWDSSRDFTIIDFAGAGTSTGVFDLVTTNAGSFASEGSWSIANTSNDIVLSWAPIPEPGAVILGSMGLLLILRRRR